MTNEHYLIVSYFVVGLVSACLGLAAYRVLRRPFGAIADAAAGLRGTVLKRTLALSLTMAAVLGFLSVSYQGCAMSYEQVIKDRSYLVHVNQEQLQSAGNWIVYVVFFWGVVVVICLVVMRGKVEKSSNAPPR